MQTRAGRTYTTGSVTSRDGTIIGFRQFGHGPGVIAIHGAMQAAQNFTKLAEALADEFTVYVPDRRGRGLSGPHGDHYNLSVECEDIAALLTYSGAENVFGLSSGGIIALQSALTLPAIRKLAVYEPPLSVDHSTPTAWIVRYDREIAAGKLGSALVTAMNGVQTGPLFMRVAPRFLLDPMLNSATRAGASATDDDAPLSEIVPTMHYDVQLVMETEGAIASFRNIRADVLLMGGSKSPAYIKTSLKALREVLPAARFVEFPGLDHLAPDDTGKPDQIAAELRRFFSY